ncbi:MAG: hypothetical protein ACRDK9_09450 [Solirubrobacterales bacterium]
MSVLVFAHAGHWLAPVGFALGPLLVIAAIGVMIVRERRRG